MTKKSSAILLLLLFLLVGCVTPTKTKYILVDTSKLSFTFLPGTENKFFSNLHYPKPSSSEHFKGLGAGLFVFSNGSLPTSKISPIISYYFLIKQTKNFEKTVYTRAIYPTPQLPSKQFIFNGILLPGKEPSVPFVPVDGLQYEKKYELVFEVYQDPQRTKLLEHMTQTVVSPLEHKGSCVKIQPAMKAHFLKQNKKMHWVC